MLMHIRIIEDAVYLSKRLLAQVCEILIWGDDNCVYNRVN